MRMSLNDRALLLPRWWIDYSKLWPGVGQRSWGNNTPSMNYSGIGKVVIGTYHGNVVR
jgi:hypothetical protein